MGIIGVILNGKTVDFVEETKKVYRDCWWRHQQKKERGRPDGRPLLLFGVFEPPALAGGVLFVLLITLHLFVDGSRDVAIQAVVALLSFCKITGGNAISV